MTGPQVGTGKVFRIILDGEGLDLMGAFAGARMEDYRALIMDTGRGASAVRLEVEQLQSTDTAGALTGAQEMTLYDTITDLVFLAKRVNGGRLHWQEVADTMPPFFEVMAEFGKAVEAAQAAADAAETGTVDPTTAPTATDRGESDEAPASRTP